MATTNKADTKWYAHTASVHTMKTWARQIEVYAEIPEKFIPALPQFGGAPLPHTIYIPGYRLSWCQEQPETLICLCADQMVCLQSVGGDIQTKVAPYAEVLYLEHGKVLLEAWMKIGFPTGPLYFRFNAANEAVFTPLMAKIRQGWDARPPEKGLSHPISGAQPVASPLDCLAAENFKFMNYGRNALRPNDALVTFAYQPERRLRSVKLFNRKLYERYSTAHLTLVTENELILLKECAPTKRNLKMIYGGIFTYVPRHGLRSITFDTDDEKGLTIMAIAFPCHQLTATFARNHAVLEVLREKLCSNHVLLTQDNE